MRYSTVGYLKYTVVRCLLSPIWLNLLSDRFCSFDFCSLNNLNHHDIMFPQNQNIYGTRYGFLLRIPKVNSKKYGEHSLAFNGCTLFNFSSDDVIRATTYPRFRHLLRNHLLLNNVMFVDD